MLKFLIYFFLSGASGANIAESIDVALNKISDLASDSITFIGNGSIIHKDLILQKFPSARFSSDNIKYSISLAKCAYDKYLKGDYGDSNHILPLYLRKSRQKGLNMEINISNMTFADLENLKDFLQSDFDEFWSYDILLSLSPAIQGILLLKI